VSLFVTKYSGQEEGAFYFSVFGLLNSSCCGKSKNENVIPAEAGIQVEKLDSRLRGNDKNQYPQQIIDRFFGFALE